MRTPHDLAQALGEELGGRQVLFQPLPCAQATRGSINPARRREPVRYRWASYVRRSRIAGRPRQRSPVHELGSSRRGFPPTAVAAPVRQIVALPSVRPRRGRREIVRCRRWPRREYAPIRCGPRWFPLTLAYGLGLMGAACKARRRASRPSRVAARATAEWGTNSSNPW